MAGSMLIFTQVTFSDGVPIAVKKSFYPGRLKVVWFSSNLPLLTVMVRSHCLLWSDFTLIELLENSRRTFQRRL